MLKYNYLYYSLYDSNMGKYKIEIVKGCNPINFGRV